MPFIEESDLLELHKNMDKYRIINERLLDQIKYKSKEIERSKVQRNFFVGITGLFLIVILAITYFDYVNSSANFEEQSNLLVSVDSLDASKSTIYNLKVMNEELSLVKDFYLAKNFLEKEKIYSVQIKSFIDNNIILTSTVLTNTLFVKKNPFYSYSIGNFETLEEARLLRYQLVKMGFDDAFIASYKNGKRIKIEEPH